VSVVLLIADHAYLKGYLRPDKLHKLCGVNLHGNVCCWPSLHAMETAWHGKAYKSEYCF